MSDTKRPQQTNKPKEHLFSPHTNQCIYCGKSAEEDAVENTPCGSDEPPPCQSCGGKGWFFLDTGNEQSPRYEIQRCDVCEQFDSDIAALNAVEKVMESQPALLKFVEEVSLLKHEREPGEDGEHFDRPSEDFIATLNQLIMEARELLGTADKCDKCKETVPYVIGCPDGADLCQDCFDDGQH